MPETVQFHKLEIDDPRSSHTVAPRDQRKLCIRLVDSKPTGLCWCNDGQLFDAQDAKWKQEVAFGFSHGSINGIGLIFNVVDGTQVSRLTCGF